MAVLATKMSRKLQLQLDAGIIDGKQKFVNRNYSNLKPAATNANLHNLALTIAGLQSKSLIYINVIDTDQLTEE